MSSNLPITSSTTTKPSVAPVRCATRTGQRAERELEVRAEGDDALGRRAGRREAGAEIGEAARGVELLVANERRECVVLMRPDLVRGLRVPAVEGLRNQRRVAHQCGVQRGGV